MKKDWNLENLILMFYIKNTSEGKHIHAFLFNLLKSGKKENKKCCRFRISVHDLRVEIGRYGLVKKKILIKETK